LRFLSQKLRLSRQTKAMQKGGGVIFIYVEKSAPKKILKIFEKGIDKAMMGDYNKNSNHY